MLYLCAGHAKLIVSMLKDIQENDQRVTMLQLVEKLKVKQKNLGKIHTIMVLRKICIF